MPSQELFANPRYLTNRYSEQNNNNLLEAELRNQCTIFKTKQNPQIHSSCCFYSLAVPPTTFSSLNSYFGRKEINTTLALEITICFSDIAYVLLVSKPSKVLNFISLKAAFQYLSTMKSSHLCNWLKCFQILPNEQGKCKKEFYWFLW